MNPFDLVCVCLFKLHLIFRTYASASNKEIMYSHYNNANVHSSTIDIWTQSIYHYLFLLLIRLILFRWSMVNKRLLIVIKMYEHVSSRFWAGSCELRVIKWDEFFPLLCLNYMLITNMTTRKKIHLDHFELQVIFDCFWRNLTIFSLFDQFLGNFFGNPRA